MAIERISVVRAAGKGDGENARDMGRRSFLWWALSCVICIVVASVLATIRIVDSRFSKAKGTIRFAIFECPGGTDKGANGHRVDTGYLLDAFHKEELWKHAGNMKIETQVVQFRDRDFDRLVEQVSTKFDAYVSRVDPGEYEECTEDMYMKFLNALIKRGVVPFNSPGDMMRMGSKASLFKLQGTQLSLNGTNLYHTRDQFLSNFPNLLKSERNRVLKRNRGSKGEGVWWVSVDTDALGGDQDDTAGGWASSPIFDIQHGDMAINAVEACDPNHTVYKSRLRDFVADVVYEYLPQAGDENDAVLDMEYLPRIKEGEVRLILAGHKVVSVVNKQPAKLPTGNASDVDVGGNGGNLTHFSTNADAGATHKWETPKEWDHIVSPFQNHLPDLLERMGVGSPPILWTVDFIRYGEPGSEKDKLVISEINASCVGFAANPEFAKSISKRCAKKTFKVLTRRHKQHEGRIGVSLFGREF